MYNTLNEHLYGMEVHIMSDKITALKTALAQIEKQYGKGWNFVGGVTLCHKSHTPD